MFQFWLCWLCFVCLPPCLLTFPKLYELTSNIIPMLIYPKNECERLYTSIIFTSIEIFISYQACICEKMYSNLAFKMGWILDTKASVHIEKWRYKVPHWFELWTLKPFSAVHLGSLPWQHIRYSGLNFEPSTKGAYIGAAPSSWTGASPRHRMNV
jgi:hypothetical protein